MLVAKPVQPLPWYGGKARGRGQWIASLTAVGLREPVLRAVTVAWPTLFCGTSARQD